MYRKRKWFRKEVVLRVLASAGVMTDNTNEKVSGKKPFKNLLGSLLTINHDGMTCLRKVFQWSKDLFPTLV